MDYRLRHLQIPRISLIVFHHLTYQKIPKFHNQDFQLNPLMENQALANLLNKKDKDK